MVKTERSTLIDGGTFRCGNHEKEFETDSVSEWKDHLESHGQTLWKQGGASCAICGKTIAFDKHPSHLNAIHPECLQQLNAQNEVPVK